VHSWQNVLESLQSFHSAGVPKSAETPAWAKAIFNF